jgi:excinuclease ABC subunit A
VTGPSGSGKSTLAFDVIFAEGQRRFLETLTPYARQFLPMLPRADVDRVTGVPPSDRPRAAHLARGSNSTVATVTEVAHYLRLLYAKVGRPLPHLRRADRAMHPDEPDARVAALPAEASLLAPRSAPGRARTSTCSPPRPAPASSGPICDGKVLSDGHAAEAQEDQEHTIDVIISEGIAVVERAVSDALSSSGGPVMVGHGAPEIEAGKGDPLLLSTSRTCRSLRHRRPRARPALVLVQHEAGAVLLLRGLRASRPPTEHPCAAPARARASPPCPGQVRLAGLRYHEVMRSRSARAAWSPAPGPSTDPWRPSPRRPQGARTPPRLPRRGGPRVPLPRPPRRHPERAARCSACASPPSSARGSRGPSTCSTSPRSASTPRHAAPARQPPQALVAMGSTVLMVEHDADTIRAADHLDRSRPLRRPRRRAHRRAGPPAQCPR